MAEASIASRALDALAVAEKAHYPFKNYRHARTRSVLFVGCNVASLFPRTVEAAVRLLGEYGVGVVYDCCGAPLALEGDGAEAARVRGGVMRRLRERGVEEVVALCPTCASVLEREGELRVVSVYAKLRELGLGCTLAPDGAVFPPCPDRRDGTWLRDVLAFFEGDPPVLAKAPCCGLGEGGGPRRPDQARAMARACIEQARAAAAGPLYVYCASCAGSFATHGEPEVRYVLSGLLGIVEEPHVRSALFNRARAAFR